MPSPVESEGKAGAQRLRGFENCDFLWMCFKTYGFYTITASQMDDYSDYGASADEERIIVKKHIGMVWLAKRFILNI